MDFKNILNQIEQADPEVFEKISPRRHILQSFGSKVALAAVPLALGSLFNKAYGKKTDAVVDVLNFALQLEFLEYNFYYQAVNTSGLIVNADTLEGITKIMNHEREHVNFLYSTIAAMGTPYTPPHYSGSSTSFVSPASFDFTYRGAFPSTVFADLELFLAVSQTFEDTGVRAYKGQAGNLQGTANHPYLLAALKIHSAEARHASYVRALRNAVGFTDEDGSKPKPWITGKVAAVAAVDANYGVGASGYPAEDNTTQLGVNITSLPAVSGTVSASAASEAFDEPLDKTTVGNLVANFFAA